MTTENTPLNFLEEIMEQDIKNNTHGGRILTRFPPEPNGYLHIGHAKSITVNFGLAERYGGKTNLRFDDTNPVKEDLEYVESIKTDIRWLGFEWANEFYASDYFEKLYEYACQLIQKGLAYVDDSTPEQIAEQKGTPQIPATPSPFRNRSVAENLDLFQRMRGGEFQEGSKVLRAKVDLASPNMLLRDPIMYRIKFAHHHRTGNDWCIYPMYDFAHGQSDSIEEITHSICTLEFENHRPLYNWFIEQLGIFPSHQYEFARLNLNYTIMSKRRLLQLVEQGHVTGWDDPRMPTISGLRRRGYTPESIRRFAKRVGVARREHVIELSFLEFCIREHLNEISQRAMCVLHPLKCIITNYPENTIEQLTSENNPERPEEGQRNMPFGRTIYIEHEDFMEVPPPKYFRLHPGGLVRLKSAYIIRCDEVIKNADGSIRELHCSYIPESKSGSDTSGLKVKSTIHWVEATQGVPLEVRLYDRLFIKETPGSDSDGDFMQDLNPESLNTITHAIGEAILAKPNMDTKYQFLRLGYFSPDPDSTDGHPVYNRTVTLKDGWSKEQGK